MKVVLWLICVLFLILPISGYGQNTSSATQDLTHLYSYNDQRFSSFVSSFKNGKAGHGVRVLKSLFHKSHRQFLKKYKAYSRPNDIFENGTYDCLSGTYFLSHALDDLGVKYRIIETNYHIFLIAQTGHGEVLLESTDRYNGFVSDSKAIAERIERYQQREPQTSDQLYLSRLRMFHELLPDQLPGLFYFNEAVEAFHRNELAASCNYLEQACKIYDNPRIEGFTPILIHAIEISHLEEKQKENLVELLSTHQRQSVPSLASR